MVHPIYSTLPTSGEGTFGRKVDRKLFESGRWEIDEDLKLNATKCKEHKRKKMKTKCVQQIEKQNETKIESQSVPFRY